MIKRTVFSCTNFPKVFIFCAFNIDPHSPDDGSLEPKHYSVDFAFQ